MLAAKVPCSLASFLFPGSLSLLPLWFLAVTSQIPCTCVPSLHGVSFLWIFVTLYSLSFLFICQAKKSPLATLFKIVSSCPQCAISLSSLILLSAPVTFQCVCETHTLIQAPCPTPLAYKPFEVKDFCLLHYRICRPQKRALQMQMICKNLLQEKDHALSLIIQYLISQWDKTFGIKN